MTVSMADLYTILPLVVTFVWSLALMVVDLWVPERSKGITAFLAFVGLSVGLALTVVRQGGALAGSVTAFSGMVVVDGMSTFLQIIFFAAGIVGVFLAHEYLQRMKLERGEYYVLLLFSVCGMGLIVSAQDLIIIFLSLEMMSIPLYILAGFARPRVESEEAALKYFLLGTFASGFVLYGTAMMFGATAHTDLPGVMAAIQSGKAFIPLLLVSAGLLLVGFGFKMGLVPFHQWVPDVYQGAPSPATGFMAVGAKAAGMAVLLRVFVMVFATSRPGSILPLSADLAPILVGLSTLTMVVGNIIALNQKNIKRLLACSGIASAGYLMMAFVPYGQKAVQSDVIAAILFYLASYAVTSFGAWAVVSVVEKAENKGLEISDYAGLGFKYPWLGASMTVFLLSFIGFPLTLGFWSKFYLFRVAIEGGYLSLAVVGLLASLVSAYYFLRVVAVMYMQGGEVKLERSTWSRFLAVLAALAVVALSFVPGALLELAARVVLRVQ